MSEFKPIETQEQFDAVLKDRLQRERETQAKKYEGWASPEELQKLIEERDKTIRRLEEAAAETVKQLEAKDSEIAESAKYKTDLEKTRIAIAAGLKLDYVDRIRGENAEEWKADAEMLAKDFSAAHLQAPLGSQEPTTGGEPNTAKQFESWFNQQFNN